MEVCGEEDVEGGVEGSVDLDTIYFLHLDFCSPRHHGVCVCVCVGWEGCGRRGMGWAGVVRRVAVPLLAAILNNKRWVESPNAESAPINDQLRNA